MHGITLWKKNTGYGGHIPGVERIFGKSFTKASRKGLREFNDSLQGDHGPYCEIITPICDSRRESFGKYSHLNQNSPGHVPGINSIFKDLSDIFWLSGEI